MSKLVSNTRFWKSSACRLASIIEPRKARLGLFVAVVVLVVI